MTLIIGTSSSTDTLQPGTPQARRPSDEALAVYTRLSPEEWHGRYVLEKGEIRFPDAARARDLFAAAKHRAQADGDPVAAVHLLEQALRADYCGALDNGELLAARVEAYAALGRREPLRAFLLYDIAYELSQVRHWREAAIVYHQASRLDPALVWPLNNLAWMLATADEPAIHHGPASVEWAAAACRLSGWGNWCFLGTLAASFARAGDFTRAVAWQRIALHLAPRYERGELSEALRGFEAGQAFVDRGRKPAAGSRLSQEELAAIDVPRLLAQARELIDAPPTTVH